LLTLRPLGHAANNAHAAVPWKLIAEDPNKFFDAMYIPNHVQLHEISKMRAEALQACYSFWYKRQEQGEQAFLFKHVHGSDFRDPKPKRKRPAPHGDEDDEDDDGNGFEKRSSVPARRLPPQPA
jgi:hypothetical protein